MNEERPTWHVMHEPDKDWHEQAARRFDAPLPADVFAARPVLNPQQPTPEQIADAARLAADDMATVMRHWTFSAISDLPNLRDLLRLLTPPAPRWETMTEDLEAARQFVAAMEKE